jgi:hypothetical protein
MKLHIAILLLAVGAFASCKSNSTSPSSNNTNNGGGSVPTTPHTMVFTANGITYTDTNAYAVQTSVPGIMSITVAGGNDGTTAGGLGLALINESTVGTSYEVGPISFTGSSTSYATMDYGFNNNSGDTGTYSSPIAGTSSVGNITITSLSARAFKPRLMAHSLY